MRALLSIMLSPNVFDIDKCSRPPCYINDDDLPARVKKLAENTRNQTWRGFAGDRRDARRACMPRVQRTIPRVQRSMKAREVTNERREPRRIRASMDGLDVLTSASANSFPAPEQSVRCASNSPFDTMLKLISLARCLLGSVGAGSRGVRLIRSTRLGPRP
jgi:hypothetical protein